MKFVGRYAAVERSGGDGDDEDGRERSFRSSSVLARRIVNDLTIIWPPNLRPLTAEEGLKEMSGEDLVSFFFLIFLIFLSFSSMAIVAALFLSFSSLVLVCDEMKLVTLVGAFD